MRATGRIFLVLGLVALVVAIVYAAAARELAGATMLVLFSVALLYVSNTLLKAGTDDEVDEQEAVVWPEHAPTPSWWPIVMAAGTAVVVISLVISPILLALGVPLFLAGAAGWFRQAGRASHGHEAAEPAVSSGTESPIRSGPRVLEPVADRLVIRLPLRAVVASLVVIGVAAAIALFAVLLYSIPKGATLLVSVAVGIVILVATVFASRGRAKGGAVFRRMASFTVVPLAVAALCVQMVGFGTGTSQPVAHAAAAHAPPTAIALSAKGLAFDTGRLELPAGTPVTVRLSNRDTAPHNFAIYRTSNGKDALFQGKLVNPGQSTTYAIPALPAGRFFFRCDVHPFMHGVVVSR